MKKIFLLITLGFLVSFFAAGQTIEELLKEADGLEKQLKEEEAYTKYKYILSIDANQLKALLRSSDLAARIGFRQRTKKAQQEYYTEAKNLAEQALAIDSNSADAYCAMSIAKGRMALIADGAKEKMSFVRDIKGYAEKALAKDANNFKAYHILGKWNYEVSDLNVLEKAAAKILYGGLPKASLEDAIKYYEKARTLQPGFVLNYLELAKAYHRFGKDDKAIEVLKIMLKISNKTADDAGYKAEAQKMITDMQ